MKKQIKLSSKSAVDTKFLITILIALIIVVVVTMIVIKGKNIVLNQNKDYDNMIEKQTGINISEEIVSTQQQIIKNANKFNLIETKNTQLL